MPTVEYMENVFDNADPEVITKLFVYRVSLGYNGLRLIDEFKTRNSLQRSSFTWSFWDQFIMQNAGSSMFFDPRFLKFKPLVILLISYL